VILLAPRLAAGLTRDFWGVYKESALRFSLMAFLSLGTAFGQGIPVPFIAAHPFSADEVIVREPSPHVHMDILKEMDILRETIKVYRDSAGRTRTDVSVPPNPTETPYVMIIDPGAGVTYALDTKNKVARRFSHPHPAGWTVPTTDVPSSGRWITPGMPGNFTMRTETLGSKLIEGLAADGKRISSASPKTHDEAQENVIESWYSPELLVILLNQQFNSVLGNSTARLENINRAEPDPALFQVPPDYTIVDAAKNQ